MSKVTVGFCKSKGIEFVEGDVVNSNSQRYPDFEGFEYQIADWINDSSPENKHWESSEVKEFAWRENTGEQPYAGGVVVEVECESGIRLFEGICDKRTVDWSNLNTPSGITKWRPHLPSLQKEYEEVNSEQEEAFEREFDCVKE